MTMAPTPRRLARLLQAPVRAAQAASSPTAALVIELARARAVAITLAEAMGAVALASTDAEVAAFALEALTRAEHILS
jgi:hypothetical protein